MLERDREGGEGTRVTRLRRGFRAPDPAEDPQRYPFIYFKSIHLSGKSTWIEKKLQLILASYNKSMFCPARPKGGMDNFDVF